MDTWDARPVKVRKGVQFRYNPSPVVCEVELLFTWEKLDYVDKIRMRPSGFMPENLIPSM